MLKSQFTSIAHQCLQIGERGSENHFELLIRNTNPNPKHTFSTLDFSSADPQIQQS